MFKKAVKKNLPLRMAIDGPSGSGKTYSALAVASGLSDKIAVIDTEHGSASKYADQFDFDVLELDSFHPQKFMDAVQAADKEGYGVIVIDSLSHAWAGKDGLLEQVDKIVKRSQSGNSFSAWKDATPIQTRMIETILAAKAHVIVTMRVKSEYVIEENDRGKKTPRKIGMAPVQRDQMEYEFDVYGSMNQDHELIVTKSRCPALTDSVVSKPGKELAQQLSEWLNSGVRAENKPKISPEELTSEYLGTIDACTSEDQIRELYKDARKAGISGDMLKRIEIACTKRIAALKEMAAVPQEEPAHE